MPKIRRLDVFILKSFCLLFAGTFFICLFIFMMQFLWKYVDDMVGKGLEMSVLAEFFFYSALTLVPVSLPLAVLLAALITFGNFGERFELLAMKAAGISLIKIMRPLIVLMCGVCLVSFYFQDVIGPSAQVKLWTLLMSMKQKSPELEIPEGAFYDEIEGYNLYVKHKNRKTGMLYDMMIYNFDGGFDNAQIICADSGRIEMTADRGHLYLHLFSGEQFENLKSQKTSKDNVPYRRETFVEKHIIIEFDSDFSMVDNDAITGHSSSKNMRTLVADIDSMEVRNDSIGREYFEEAINNNYRPTGQLNAKDSIRLAEQSGSDQCNIDSLLQAATLSQKSDVLNAATKLAQQLKGDWEVKNVNIEQTDGNLRRHRAAWHEKITLSLACMIFFFIGAPLGGIIRKGGLGMPVVVSVLIFIFYYIVNNTGYKMARDGKWIVWIGMWTSTAILAPIGAYLTYKSNNDSVVLNVDAYIAALKRFFGIREVRHVFVKEVIIDDPDYSTLPERLAKLSADCIDYASRRNLRSWPNYYRMWTAETTDTEVESLSERLEELVDEMGNSRSSALVASLNSYPILATKAHTRPFQSRRLNMLCGALVPVGVFFYFRIRAYRLRLDHDMRRIAENNEVATQLIGRIVASEQTTAGQER